MNLKTRLVATVGLAGLGMASCHHEFSDATLPATPKSASTAALSTAVASTMDRQIANALDAGDGDYQLRTLRSKLDRNPSDLAARLELAERYSRLGFPEIAIEHGRLAVERAPDSEEARLSLAKMLRAAGRSAEAEQGLVSFSKSHEGSARLWAWLGL